MKDACIDIRAEVHSECVIAVFKSGRAAAFTLAGDAAGPVFRDAVKFGECFGVLPRHPLAVVRRYGRGEVCGVDWSSGRTIWCQSGLKDIQNIAVLGVTRVMVRLGSGRCVELDGVTGRRIASANAVRNIASDSLLDVFVAQRVVKGKEVFEVRSSWARPPQSEVELDITEMSRGALSAQHIVVTSNDLGTTTCISPNGTTLWTRHEDGLIPNMCGLGGLESPYFYPALALRQDGKQVVAIRRPKGRGLPTQCVEIDAATGSTSRIRDIPANHVAILPVLDGDGFVSNNGLLHISDLSWSPLDFSI